MLDQSRFLAMKNLAQDVRKENEKKFKEFEKEEVDDAIRDKDELISKITSEIDNSFSEGEEGKEEQQIFRANVLIPNDIDFFQSYSKDKNVRNLMTKYAVGIEDIMSKITELNLYSKYIDIFNEEQQKQDEDDDFVDSMVDLSKDEAKDLLNEIEGLSIPEEDRKDEEETFKLEPETVNETEEFEDIEEPKIEESESEDSEDDQLVDIEIEGTTESPSTSPDIEISDEIENISSAVFEFVDEYSKVKRELEFTQAKVDKFNSEKEELRKKLSIAKDENEEISKENESLRNDIERFYQQTRKLNDEKQSLQNKLDDATSEIRKAVSEKMQKEEELSKVVYEAEKLAAENETLRSKITSMEETVKQSTNLLKEIYKTIPKKRFNVK